jgi:hypothetical protein
VHTRQPARAHKVARRKHHMGQVHVTAVTATAVALEVPRRVRSPRVVRSHVLRPDQWECLVPATWCVHNGRKTRTLLRGMWRGILARATVRDVLLIVIRIR